MFARTSSVRPCSGSSRVAVRTTASAEVLADAVRDRAVHAVGVPLGDVLLDLFVEVLAPDGDAERGAGHGVCLSGVVGPGHLTAPPVAPAAMNCCATSSSTMAGIEASTAVAMTVDQSAVKVPM